MLCSILGLLFALGTEVLSSAVALVGVAVWSLLRVRGSSQADGLFPIVRARLLGTALFDVVVVRCGLAVGDCTYLQLHDVDWD